MHEKGQDQLPLVSDMVAVPPGYFLNWRSGARRLVPRWATRWRWRSIIEDAVNNDRVAHVWLHPHNIITSPETLELLDFLLVEVVQRGGAVACGLLTQATYCCEALLTATGRRSPLRGSCALAGAV